MPATVTRAAAPPNAEMHHVTALMNAEGLRPYRWENDPGDVYAPHAHTYHKVLYCLRGSIRFVLTGEASQVLELHAGDRMDLEPGTEHSAYVGNDGVACLEAQR
jgi:quercetin dioxygenase-like cupin family protein